METTLVIIIGVIIGGVCDFMIKQTAENYYKNKETK